MLIVIKGNNKLEGSHFIERVEFDVCISSVDFLFTPSVSYS